MLTIFIVVNSGKCGGGGVEYRALKIVSKWGGGPQRTG